MEASSSGFDTQTVDEPSLGFLSLSLEQAFTVRFVASLNPSYLFHPKTTVTS